MNRSAPSTSTWKGRSSLIGTVLLCFALLLLQGRLESQHAKTFYSPEHGWGTVLGDDLVAFDRDNANVHQKTILNSLTAEEERTSPPWLRLSNHLLRRVLDLTKAGSAELLIPTTAFDGENLGYYFLVQTKNGVCPSSRELGDREYLDKVVRASLAKVHLHPEESNYTLNTEKYSWRDINNTEAAIVEGWIDAGEQTIAHWSIAIIPGGDRVFIVESYASPQYRAEARLRAAQVLAGFRGGAWKSSNGINPIFLMAAAFLFVLIGWSLVHFAKRRAFKVPDEDIFIECGPKHVRPRSAVGSAADSAAKSAAKPESESLATVIADDEIWHSSQLWKQQGSIEPEDRERGPDPGSAGSKG